MGKRGKKYQKKGSKKAPEEDKLGNMDDEIDAFLKQRDVVPLDVNDDMDETDEDNELPVYDIEGEDDDVEDEDEDIDDEDAQSGGLAAKIIRQKKYLRAKFGDVDDEMADDDDDGQDEEDKRATWGGKKARYRGGDTAEFEALSSDDEALAEEEAEVLRLQRKAAESLTAEDVGLEDDDEEEDEEESDRELTLEEISTKGKPITKSIASEAGKTDMDTAVEEIKKDINSLSREEQMDVVYSSAPELVGLLSELNDAVDQLENKINPVMSKLKGGETPMAGGIRYLEVKQLLLLAYCQAITFYLLLKSEGQPVRDHPVIARLVEIKGLLDKMKELDGNLPTEFEEILKKHIEVEPARKVVKENILSPPVSVMSGAKLVGDNKEEAEVLMQNNGTTHSLKEDSSNKNVGKGEKRKRQNDQVGLLSMEMLKVRAALEERLKNNGMLGSIVSKQDKAQKRAKPINGKLETFDDYEDETSKAQAAPRGLTSNKLSQLVSAKQKPKVVSGGDDDLPKRDDIGERRRKHELRVLAGAGVKSEDDIGDGPETLESESEEDATDMMGDDDTGSSEDDFYEQVKRQREEKLAAKADIYSRKSSTIPSLPETVEGKRQISYQMVKNRGLTRKRNKDLKNPRKKYRTKHAEKVKRRKGQIQQIKKPSGPYGGETTGINAGISRSIRFKN